MQYLPRPCWDLLAAGKIQVFQLCRLAQGLKQICGALCSFRCCVEAPAVFCQNQSLERMLGRRLSPGIHSILNPPQSTPTPTTTSQISPLPNFTNRRRKQENLQHHPSTISLCQALIEICLLQVEPLGTTNFLPCPCWDLRTVSKIQLFQQRRLIQCLKQICSSICSFRVCVEAPAVFCQNQSVEKMLGRRHVHVHSILNPSRLIPTQI